jgi:putative protease
VWLGPDVELDAVRVGRRVWKTDDPRLDKQLLDGLAREPHRVPIALTVSGDHGAPFVVEARSARGHVARVVGDVVITRAERGPLDPAIVADKLGRLGDSPFVLDGLEVSLPSDALVPPAALNRARRQLVDALVASAVERPAPARGGGLEAAYGAVDLASLPTPPPGLFVLVRSLEQAEAALAAGADGIYLDFLELTGTSRALARLRTLGARFVGVAPPRIRKPGEEKIDRHLRSLAPDAVLVRGLGALREHDAWGDGPRPLRVADFSLNVTNQLTAFEVLRRAVDVFTPSFDLDATQLEALLATPAGRLAELVVHHPMPLFHDEHCLYAALLSEGRDHRTCGRPCDRHKLSLRDRAGMDHPVEADVGCRNTVFHARAQSAAELVPMARRRGVGRFRVELVREGADETRRVVEAYRGLLAGGLSAGELFRGLRTDGGYGVVRGSLRVLG